MQQHRELIQKCSQIFLSQGLKVSMDDIARELRVSKRTLYEIFENKTELVQKSVDLFFEIENEKIEYYLSQSGNIIEEMFPVLNFDIYNRMKKYGDFFRDVKKLYPEVFEKIVASHLDTYKSRIGKIIIKGIKQGFFREDVNVGIVEIFLYDLQTTREHNKELFEKYFIGDIFQNTLLSYIRGLCTDKGIQLIEDILHRDYPYFKDKKDCIQDKE